MASTQTAYITGGASGIGKATAIMLMKKGVRVFISDRDVDTAQTVVSELNSLAESSVAACGPLDAADWNSQAKVFSQAVTFLGRIDQVYPIAGIGERRWILKPDAATTEFEKPDLTVLDVDLTGVLYTISLAIQQFRRQEVKGGSRGRVSCIASICGFYCATTLPIYTAAKHGIIGFVRSYGKYLPSEQISINAVAPNVLRTNISTSAFYDSLADQGLLTPIGGVIDTLEALFDGELKDYSGDIFEVGPEYGQGGQKWVFKEPTPFLDEKTKALTDLLSERGISLQKPA